MTYLSAGRRVKKSDKVIEALGVIDELNAWVGSLRLNKVQDDLMEINAGIAGVRIKGLESRIKDLEQEINTMQEKLPPLRNFILPQNQFHIVRAVCRRAERRVVDADGHQQDILRYLNRLSDYLFVLARYTDWKKGRKEIIWKNEGRRLLEKVPQRIGSGKRDKRTGD